MAQLSLEKVVFPFLEIMCWVLWSRKQHQYCKHQFGELFTSTRVLMPTQPDTPGPAVVDKL